MNKLNTWTDSKFFEAVIGRPEIKMLSDENLQSHFKDSRILIIGAGGSIGAALSHRLEHAQIPELFFLDHDESALHNLALSLSNVSASQSHRYLLADIRDFCSIKNAIETVKPTIVVHAAALKHLVMLERFPREGYLTNIEGTLNLAIACRELKVNQLINISTDKAANPISVLGMTKKIAELITEEVFRDSNLLQCSVRFGNVFASRGSVIETFVHQIYNSLPVTITSLEVSRFFMSHNEAANLVLAAASLKESGTYIQNMGDEIKIIDVVNRIAKYAERSATIKIIGLQKGEKIQEELFDGPTSPTQFDEISLSIHELNPGLIREIQKNSPISHEEALIKIKKLMTHYIVKK